MSLRICGTDTRNPARWSKTDRTARIRNWERGIVSNFWTANPFGMSGTKAFPQVQPGVFRVNGSPAGDATTFNRAWGQIVDSNPQWSLLDGRPVEIWRSGDQSTTAVDLARIEVVETWTSLLLQHFNWADGIHFDYFTDLAWLDPSISQQYWRGWNVAYALVMRELSLHRPDWLLIGQQFHLTPITKYVDGLYLEESPGHFGLTFEQIAADMAAHGQKENWIVEVRNPTQFPQWYLDQCVNFVRQQGCLLSWGRDATAGLGVPA